MDYPADPGCSSLSDTDESDPLPPQVEVTPGSYKGQTQTGDFVFFDVLTDRTIRGFRANDLRQECDGPLIIYGPLDFGPTPNPIRPDGGFLYQYDGPGSIRGEKGELFPATFHIKVAGSIQGSSAAGTASFSSEFDFEDRHWRCSSGEKTWTANRLP